MEIKSLDLLKVNRESWNSYRKDIIRLFAEEEYGFIPDGWKSHVVWTDSECTSEYCKREGIVSVQYRENFLDIPFCLWFPGNIGKPVPCVIYVNGEPLKTEKTDDSEPVSHEIPKEIIEMFHQKMRRLLKDEEQYQAIIEDENNKMKLQAQIQKPNTLMERDDWPVGQLLADGFATATFYTGDLCPDGPDWISTGLFSLFHSPDFMTLKQVGQQTDE